MENQPTCGQGLAEHSALPAKLGGLTAAVAVVLERHMEALDLTDERSEKEYRAYRDLAEKHRSVAIQLTEIAQHMAAYRDLPMGRHDPAAMASPEAVETFRRFLENEQDLLVLLQERIERDQHMLGEMAGSSALPGVSTRGSAPVTA
jgi:hypothetical protein